MRYKGSKRAIKLYLRRTFYEEHSKILNDEGRRGYGRGSVDC